MAGPHGASRGERRHGVVDQASFHLPPKATVSIPSLTLLKDRASCCGWSSVLTHAFHSCDLMGSPNDPALTPICRKWSQGPMANCPGLLGTQMSSRLWDFQGYN